MRSFSKAFYGASPLAKLYVEFLAGFLTKLYVELPAGLLV